MHVDNINVYASVDGRRLGKQTGTRVVSVNPAEHIFSRPRVNNGGSADDDSVAAVLGDLPVDDAEALQEEEPDIQLASKKRVRRDLRAAVITRST